MNGYSTIQPKASVGKRDATDMGQYTYYCEVQVQHPRVEFAPGVYKVVASGGFSRSWFPKLNQVIQFSDRVWKQGPKGGVKIIKSRDWPYPGGYITTNDEWMRKFAWVKLKAKSVSV